MKVLIACEFSQTVTKAFRKNGHEAYSCDLMPTEGNPEWHIKDDVLNHLTDDHWDLMIAHPPCTYLTVSGNKWMKSEYKDRFPNRAQQRKYAIEFFMQLYNATIPLICKASCQRYSENQTNTSNHINSGIRKQRKLACGLKDFQNSFRRIL